MDHKKITEDDLKEIPLDASESDIKRMFEQVAPQLTPTPEVVAKSALKTAKTIESSLAQVDKHISDLDKIDAFLKKEAETFNIPAVPSLNDIERHERFREVIEHQLSIIAYYKDSEEIDPAMFNEDIIRLAADQVFISGALSSFQNLAANREAAAELAEAKYYIASKRASQSEDVSVSDTTAKNLAKSYAGPIMMEASEYAMISRFLFNIYLSSKAFIEMLDHCAAREFSSGVFSAKHS